MAGGQWEVVGGKAKKSKKKSSPKATKLEKPKADINFAVSEPIKESKTIFTAFLEKEKKEAVKQVKPSEPAKGKEKNGTQKKKTDKKVVVPKVSLEDLFLAIKEEDLKNHLATLEVLCPNTPLLWLKDLVVFFNVKLDISMDATTFTSKPWGYPCSLMKKGVYEQISKLFNRCTPQTLQIFHEFCLNGLVQDILKGLSILGYCTILQCLAQEMPSIAFANLPKCAELCNAHPNRQNICLLLWWAAGQVGNKDLETGFHLWLQLMFPSMGEKHCSVYAVDYLEELVSKVKKTDFKKNIIEVRDFFPILDFIFSKDLPKGLQKRLIALYPTLKMISYGQDPENILRNYFPSFLRRLEPQCPPLLKSEILSSLEYCLEKDPRCFSVWRQLYTKHIIQSKLLIGHLNDQWEMLPSKFPKRCLQETISVFQVTNEEMMNSSKKNADVEECSLINKELLSKISASKFPWLRLFGFLILLVSMLLTYDVMTHKSFAESNVGRLMKDAGLLTVCTQAGNKLLYFYGKISKLFQQYSPPFIVWCKTSLVSFVDTFIKELSSILSYVWSSSSTLRAWCNEKFPPLLEQIEAQIPSYNKILVLLKSVSVFILHYLSLAWESAGNIALSLQSNEQIAYLLEMSSLYSRLLIGNIQQYAASLLQHAQAYSPWSAK